jgi:hypothetical protein
MHQNQLDPQAIPEAKDRNVAVRCTASEKRAVQFVALAHGSTESDVMRDMTMAEITAEAARGMTLISDSAADAAA